MAIYGVHICNFSTALDGLSRKDQADDEKVIACLRKSGRFSAFEASANPTIARTMTRLCQTRLTTDPSCGYPWVRITAIDGEPLVKEEIGE